MKKKKSVSWGGRQKNRKKEKEAEWNGYENKSILYAVALNEFRTRWKVFFFL